MPHPELFILGYSEALMWLQRKDAADLGAIILVAGNREPLLPISHSHQLTLHFDDTTLPREGNYTDQYRAIAQRNRDAADNRLREAPTLDDAAIIVDFARSLQSSTKPILIQCAAGISRSPAIALLCLCAWNAPGSEASCVAELFRTRPHAQPHRDLVRFGDDYLNCNGALVKALEAHLNRA